MGGFPSAFKKTEAEICWSNDSDKYACETLRHNYGHRIIEKDIRKLHVYEDDLEPVDVLTAGFPCQPFSIAGKKQGFSDERARGTLQAVIRIIKEFGRAKPKILLLENVKHLLEHDKGRTFAEIKAMIQRAGYWFDLNNAKILNTSTHTDIPQNRERIYMVAFSQQHFSHNDFEFPEEVHNRRKFSEFVDRECRPGPTYYFGKESQYYKMFEDAITRDSNETTDSNEAVYQLRRVFVRKNKSGVCFTLTANMGGGGHNVPVIKDRWGIRKLTPDECLLLQGFDPQLFSFPPKLSNTQKYKQIGNSITVPLVVSLAKKIRLALKKRHTT